MIIATLKLRSEYEVKRATRGPAVPEKRTIASKKDKARRSERRDFRQNRKSW